MPVGKMELTGITREQSLTYPGMAHFAETGPKGATCKDCGNLAVVKQTPYCAKYEDLMGKVGSPIPLTASACRHYKEKAKPKPQPKNDRPFTNRKKAK